MKTIQNISVVEDVTLVSLNDSPADMNTISKIFDMISTNNIDVDMISQTPPHSNKPLYHGRSTSVQLEQKLNPF